MVGRKRNGASPNSYRTFVVTGVGIGRHHSAAVSASCPLDMSELVINDTDNDNGDFTDVYVGNADNGETPMSPSHFTASTVTIGTTGM